jgi:hypothetical protein
VLSHESGALTYVNAGHNAPILKDGVAAVSLDSSGVPLGLFPDAGYEVRTAVLSPGGAVCLITHRLPDSIRSDDPEARIRDMVTTRPSVASLMALVDRRLTTDDITIVLREAFPRAMILRDKAVPMQASGGAPVTNSRRSRAFADKPRRARRCSLQETLAGLRAL